MEPYKGKQCLQQVLAQVSELCMNCLYLSHQSTQPLTISLVVSVVSLLQSEFLIMRFFHYKSIWVFLTRVKPQDSHSVQWTLQFFFTSIVTSNILQLSFIVLFQIFKACQ